MRNAVIAATALTVTCGGATAWGYINDPGVTPMRIAGMVVLAIGLGIAWSRVFWVEKVEE